MVIYVGIAIMVIGILLFLITMFLNEKEEIAQIGFIVFCVGGFVTIAGAIVDWIC